MYMASNVPTVLKAKKMRKKARYGLSLLKINSTFALPFAQKV